MAHIPAYSIDLKMLRPENVAEYSSAVLKVVETTEGIKSLKSRYKQFADELLISLENLQKKLSVDNWDDFTKKYTLLRRTFSHHNHWPSRNEQINGIIEKSRGHRR